MSALARGAVHAVLARIRSGQIELARPTRARAKRFGPPDARLRAAISVHDPRFYGRSRAGEHRPRRELRRGALGHRRPGRAAADRRPRDVPADPARRRLAPRHPPGAPPRDAAAAQHPPRRPAKHLRPLRPRQRDVRDLPRHRVDDVLERLLRARGPVARGGAAQQARAHLPRPRAEPRRPPARDRHRLGRPRRPRRPAARLPRDHDDDLPRAARVRREPGPRRRPRGAGDRARRRLPRAARAASTSSSRSR